MTKEDTTILFGNTISSEEIKEVASTNTFFASRICPRDRFVTLYIAKDNQMKVIEIPGETHTTSMDIRYVKAIGKYILIFDMDLISFETIGKDYYLDMHYAIDTSVDIDEMHFEWFNDAISDCKDSDFSEAELNSVFSQVEREVPNDASLEEIVKLLISNFKKVR